MKYPISICLAGAVSAGAYTAGVMTELLQAIRRWENNDDLPFCPTHEIELKGFSGASAGSIQAVLSALDIFASNESQELGKDAWFKATIEKMLNLSDLQDKESVRSILNSDVLKSIANEQVKKHRWGQKWPKYISDPFELRLSVTNLRGVPYKLNLPAENSTEFGMSTHNEYLRFKFLQKAKPSRSYHNIVFGTKNKFDYDRLIEGALASSAFPIAFSPIELKRPRVGNIDYHSAKDWMKPVSIKKTGSKTTVSYKPEKREPAWNRDFGPKEDVVAVDGGATNNEPIVEAFKILFDDDFSEWQKIDHNEPQGRVLMIDPFPNAVDREIKGDDLRIDNSLGKLISALIGHARFSEPLIVSEALQNRVGLVYPSLPGRTGNLMALRSGAIGGFTGFLKKKFLEHDYALGRLNMKRFLRYHFTLPIDDILFDKWRDDNSKIEAWKVVKKNGLKEIPIIPVYEKNEKGDYQPFSGGSGGENDKDTYYKNGLKAFQEKFTMEDRDKLKKKLQARLSKVGSLVLSQHTSNDGKRYQRNKRSLIKKLTQNRFTKSLTSGTMKLGWTLFGARFLTNSIIRTIENELNKQDYLSYKIDEN